MSSYRFEPWEQPVLQSNADYGMVSASSINLEAEPYRALDGVNEGTSCSWECKTSYIPAWWMWNLPAALSISQIRLVNKYTASANSTKDVTIFSDEGTTRIASGQFESGAFTELTFTFDEPVITRTLYILCESSWETKNPLVGLSGVYLTAQKAIPTYHIRYCDWDGTVLKEDDVDYGGESKPPSAPRRTGYRFIGWSDELYYVTEDAVVTAMYEQLPIAETSENILVDLNLLLASTGIPVETGVFTEQAPDKYIVIVPLTDTFELNADNAPGVDVQEARISLFAKGNYTKDKNKIVRALLAADFTITGRNYVGYETDTGYHHYVVDVAQYYEMED